MAAQCVNIKKFQVSECNTSIDAIASLDDGGFSAIIYDPSKKGTKYLHQAKIFSKDFRFKKIIPGTGFRHFAKNRQGQLVATYSHFLDGSCIYFFHQDGTKNDEIKLRHELTPWSIAINDHNQLVVLCHQKGHPPKIMWIDASSGAELDSFDDLDGSSRISGIAINSRDDVIMTDARNHCVKTIDHTTKQGSLIFGSEGDGEGQLRSPRGVCVDKDDNILVADSENARVVLLSPDGRFVRYLLSEEDGIERPQGVALNKEGQLLVGNDKGQVFLVEYR